MGAARCRDLRYFTVVREPITRAGSARAAGTGRAQYVGHFRMYSFTVTCERFILELMQGTYNKFLRP